MADWKGRTALIISGAPQSDLSYVMDIYGRLEMPLVVCADRGLEYARKLGLQVDLFVADRDSSGACSCDEACEVVNLVPEKDDTDTMHALNILIERDCKKIVIVCATGGRIDHMLANLALCEYCADRNVFCMIADQGNLVEYHSEDLVKIRKIEGFPYFSMIPLDAELEGVTIKGAKYPLQDHLVTRAEILTVSNEFASEQVEISVKKGRWLLIRSRD